MKPAIIRGVLAAGLMVSAAGSKLILTPLSAQVPAWVSSSVPMPLATTPQAQRAAMSNLRARVDSLKNATLNAQRYASSGGGMVWQAYQAVCAEYAGFVRTLTPQQAAAGANEIAELAEGLNILGEAFANFRDDLASGRAAAQALADMCVVLRKGADVWLTKFNHDCAWLRVGALQP